MERMSQSHGYVLGEDQRVQDILAVQADLLRQEGVDPAWPGFDRDPAARPPRKRRS